MGGSTLALVAAGTGPCGAEGAQRSGVNGLEGNQNGAETNTSEGEKQTAIGRGVQRAAEKQRGPMWYERRHKQDATAGGGYGFAAKEMVRLIMQLQKAKDGLGEPTHGRG